MASHRVIVVGGGITGLVAAWELATRLGGERVRLFERDPQPGGVARTERRDGFLLEAGPDSFVTVKPAALELCRELGLAERLQGIIPGHRSFIKRSGRLVPMPAGLTGLVPSRLGPLLTTPLLSVAGRLRAGFELFVPPRRDGDDETVAAFTRRRLGQEAYDWLVEPLLAGIHAGNGERLSLAATFPALIDAERRYGGMLRQALALRRAQRRRLPSAQPAPPFVTLPGGMGELVQALTTSLPSGVLCSGVAVDAVRRGANGYQVKTALATEDATSVILAVPANVAAQLLEPLDANLAELLRTIPFVSTATVSLGYAAADVAYPLAGTGYLSPRAEGGPVVACTWVSSKFPGRAPEGSVLFRLFLGRDGMDYVVGRPDADLLALARAELRQTLEIEAAPRLVHIHRWRQRLPQYTVGHLERVAEIERRLAAYPGLTVAGASYRGAGIPDCIDSARRAVRRLTRLSGVTTSPSPVSEIRP